VSLTLVARRFLNSPWWDSCLFSAQSIELLEDCLESESKFSSYSVRGFNIMALYWGNWHYRGVLLENNGHTHTHTHTQTNTYEHGKFPGEKLYWEVVIFCSSAFSHPARTQCFCTSGRLCPCMYVCVGVCVCVCGGGAARARLCVCLCLCVLCTHMFAYTRLRLCAC